MTRWTSVHAVCIALIALSVHGAQTTECARPNALTPDGGRYCGPLVDGKLHGRGIIEWSNGTVYEGEFVAGHLSGEGRLRTPHGDLYEGEYRVGTLNGRGLATLRNGSTYMGEFRDNYYHGQGRLEHAQGYIYEGAFEYGEYHGKGIMTGDGNRYQGEFRTGFYEGQGELSVKSGEQYRGQFVRGRYEGKGRFANTSGDVYEGEFKEGEFTGQGVFTRKDRGRYEGAFEKWRFHGKGKFTDASGDAYEGNFTEGELKGTGRMVNKQRGTYEGEFRQWRFHGQGTLRLPNGDTYKGGFARGVYEGKGTLTYAAAKADGRTHETGIWRYGTLENIAEEQKFKENVETALYGQRRLLDAALASLARREPGKSNMYLLAVAGDGSQEVFRREVEFVHDQFAKRFNMNSRSLVLINSRNTVATVPMATRTSVREALKGIAERMDKQEDILFFFLTSHGSRDHEFSLNQSHMSLRGLQAKELASMLKESGIRWKVVLISACYSGGFIDAIKDEYTLVITAARHDRTSFGCADENDFTYFGRAFFKEALPRANSFEDAFGKAAALVREWETKDAKEAKETKAVTEAENKASEDIYSHPQMHSPDAIGRHLRQWWRQQPAVTAQ